MSSGHTKQVAEGNNTNLINNIDENTINNCLDEYNKLIKNKQNNVKKIKIIFDYLLE
jgi:hypothetical protein